MAAYFTWVTIQGLFLDGDITVTLRDPVAYPYKYTILIYPATHAAMTEYKDITTDTTIRVSPELLEKYIEGNTTPTSEYVKVRYDVIGYDAEGKQVGWYTTYDYLRLPSYVAPSCSMTLSDPTGYLDKYGAYVLNHSRVKADITFAGVYDSTVESCSWYINGALVDEPSTETSPVSSTSEPLNTFGEVDVVARIGDSRGRSASAYETINVLDYAPPVVTALNVRRCKADGTSDDYGAHAQVTFGASVTPLNDKNSAAYVIEYKKQSDTEYTSVVLDQYADQLALTDGTFIFEADTGAVYDVRLVVTDDFGSGSRTTSVSTAFTMMHWSADGTAMGLGKVATLPHVLDIGFRTRHYGGLLHPVLDDTTDLDAVTVPNTYSGGDRTACAYVHCPVDGPFVLEVLGVGTDDADRVQRLTACVNGSASTMLERHYTSGAWDEWQGAVSADSFTGVLPIEKGGTGGATAADAVRMLGAVSSTDFSANVTMTRDKRILHRWSSNIGHYDAAPISGYVRYRRVTANSGYLDISVAFGTTTGIGQLFDFISLEKIGSALGVTFANPTATDLSGSWHYLDGTASLDMMGLAPYAYITTSGQIGVGRVYTESGNLGGWPINSSGISGKRIQITDIYVEEA